MSDIPKLTPELELDMKRTLLMLAAKQSGVKITNVYVKNKDGTITDEVKKYVIQDPEGSTERTSRRENIEKDSFQTEHCVCGISSGCCSNGQSAQYHGGSAGNIEQYLSAYIQQKGAERCTWYTRKPD